MLKQSVTYEDFDGNTQAEVLYFNITKSELSDNLHLSDQFQKLAKMFEGPERELTMEEISEILDLVKEVMRLSYGIKSADGKSFRKNATLWEEFTQTAAYDAFLFSLFSDPAKANAFLLGAFPQDLMAQAQQQVDQGTAPRIIENARVNSLSLDKEKNAFGEGLSVVPEAPVEEDTRPLYQKEGRKPTNKELQAMDRDQILEAMKWGQGQQD